MKKWKMPEIWNLGIEETENKAHHSLSTDGAKTCELPVGHEGNCALWS